MGFDTVGLGPLVLIPRELNPLDLNPLLWKFMRMRSHKFS